ncbi:MAG: hypothetical protein CVT94_19115 [Bacteroidetes bacterium HGW-Bacteroidetes-11]|nr:MAG: hypothetical protein CVT94_19115 [Bacteroidetes bacterium HGW-Bacteroidetes-11]
MIGSVQLVLFLNTNRFLPTVEMTHSIKEKIDGFGESELAAKPPIQTLQNLCWQNPIVISIPNFRERNLPIIYRKRAGC